MRTQGILVDPERREARGWLVSQVGSDRDSPGRSGMGRLSSLIWLDWLDFRDD
jgi:hypothetical protein